MCVGEVDGRAEIAKLEVLHKFVIGGEAAGRTAEFASVVPVEEFADGAPFLGLGDDRVANFEQRRGLGMPKTAGGETSAGLQVQIKSGRVNIFSRVGEAHGDVRFVGALVVRETRVAINAEHGTA